MSFVLAVVVFGWCFWHFHFKEMLQVVSHGISE